MAKKKTKRIPLVKNCDKYGCVPACLAMVSGLSYEEVKEDFNQDFDKDGIEDRYIVQWLGDRGHSVVYKKLMCYNERTDCRNEILKPFAPIHIVEVQYHVDSRNTHVVVMDDKGNLYCPSGSEDEDIRDCYMVIAAYGIY